MVNPSPPLRRLRRVTSFLGISIDDRQIEQLQAYGQWLVEEGTRIGGMATADTTRVWDRHLLDSLLFAKECPPTASVLDVGSGIGLPGIPVAIAFPGTDVTLVDRSGRRTDALNRALAITGVRATVANRDIAGWTRSHDRIVLRAALPLPAALARLPNLVTDQGEIWFGLGRGAEPPALTTWRADPPPPPPGWTVEPVGVPPGVLDSAVWLLRIRRR